MADNQNLFSNWNFGDKSVTPEMMQGKYINARSTLIAAGPPQFSQIGGSVNTASDMVFPIGFVENFGITQQRNLQRMFEIGSNRSFFIPGRTMSSANFGRVLFHGPSLLRVLYAYYPKEKITVAGGSGIATDGVSASFNQSAFTGPACVPFINDAPGTQTNAGSCEADGGVQTPSFYMNLASTLFDHPMGILIYMKDINNEYYSAFYLEFCHVTAHSMNINATSTVIAEGVGIQFDAIQPVDLSADQS